MDQIHRVANEVGDTPEDGPVFVTRPGKAELVLLTVAEYRKLGGEKAGLAEAVGDSRLLDIPFDRSRMTIEEYRRLTGRLPNLVEMLAGPPGSEDIDFHPLPLEYPINPNREIDLSD